MSLVVWFLSKDSQLLVITNESILFFWRALSFQKLELLRRIDLKDITSVNVTNCSTGTVEVHCTAPIKRLLFMSAAPKKVIEQINKAAKLRIDHNH